ncbi:MAG: hypothetical protein ABJC10_07030 [Acidobacteriota bacterium]
MYRTLISRINPRFFYPVIVVSLVTAALLFAVKFDPAFASTVGAVAELPAAQNQPAVGSGRIMYSANGSRMYVINADPNNQKPSYIVAGELFQNSSHHPSVSSQTGRIAFAGSRGSEGVGVPLIYAMDSDGLNVHPVTSPVGLPPGVSDTVPAISPDGSQIAFISKRFGSQPNYPPTPQNPDGTPKDSEVFVVNFDGTGLHQVTSSEQTPVNNGTTVATVVAWSGNTLKVSARRGFTNDQGQRVTRTGIYTFNPDGTGESLFLQLGGLDFTDVLDAAGGIILYSLNNAIYVGSGNDLRSYTVIPASQAGGGVRFYQGVRFSPDGSRIVYSGDDDGGSIRTIGIDGSNPVLVRGNLGGTNGGIWWFDAPPIPTPARLRLDPAVVRVVNDGVTMSRVTPSLLDANGNVIFHAADFSTPCGAGYPCTLNPNNFTYFSDGRIRVTNANNTPGYISFCGANGGLSGCSVVSVGTDVDFAEINSSVPSANTNGTGGPGIFTVRRESTEANSALIVNFTLGGTAVRDVDYSLDIVGNIISFSPGQTSFDIRVTPLRAAGNKTVSMNIAAQSGASYLTYAGRETATINIVDNGPPAAAFFLSSITPNTGGDGGSVTSTVYGTSIRSAATVRLTRTGQADIVGSNTSVAANGLSITTTFDLTGKALGLWNVVVTNPGNTTATLAAAFTIEKSQGDKVWVDLVGRYTMRSNLTQTFYIVYGNSGDVDSPPTRFLVYIPAPLDLTGYPILKEVAGLGRGTVPNITKYEGGTMLEFYVPKVNANTSTYAPFELTAPDELLHKDIDLQIDALISPHPYKPDAVQTDPSVTLTPEVLEATDTHARIVQHVRSPTVSGDITSEITLTDVQEAHDPIINITNDGTTIRWNISVTVPKSVLTKQTLAPQKANPGAQLPGEAPSVDVPLHEQIFEGGVASIEVYLAAGAAIEAREAVEKGVEFDELADCLVRMGKISEADADSVKRANSGRNLVRISSAAVESSSAIATILKKSSVPISLALYAAGKTVNVIDSYVLEQAPLNAFRKGVCEGPDGAKTPYFELCHEINASKTNSEENEKAKQALFDQLILDCLLFEHKLEVSKIYHEYYNLHLHVVASGDPNEKDGSQGAGTPQFVTGTEPLRYVISFENISTATAPAQTVVVTDQLDPAKVDLSTVSLGAFNFGINGTAPATAVSSYSADIDLRPAKNLIARVNGQVDENTGLLTWRFTSIDPATGQPTTDPLAGFLPPDTNPPDGQGSVTFSVMPKQNLATGTEIRNKARIIFDNNAPIDTNEYLNTIDNSLPASHVLPLAGVQSSIVFNVNWTGTDTGSGVQSYDVYASENGGPFTLWQSNATATAGTFIGKPGTGYSFYSLSRDGAGNLEPAKTTAEAGTTTRNDITNSVDDTRFYVRQHYLDFLSREPDQSGWDFWTNNIESCGTNAQCREVKRIDTSAAYFLSIEFQQTGYLVYRAYKAAYGNLQGKPVPLGLSDFLPDTQGIGQGVVVGQTGWEQKLENNKAAYFNSFVSSARFIAAYPQGMTAAGYVDALFANAGVAPTAQERQTAITAYGAGDAAGRVAALRSAAESQTLQRSEFNRAFVLMQYFGYLRRNPNDAPDADFSGYNFWLQKLNSFGGDYRAAEMVKAFIVSGEYRKRFGP